MTFKHILVATDFSACGESAIDLAVELAQKLGAALTLVHSWEVPSYAYGEGLYVAVDYVTPIQDAAKAHLESTLSELKKRIPNAKSILRSGPAWEQVLAAATEAHADLIVVGTHGRRGVSHALLGSVAEKIVRMAELPVLTVHSAPRAS